MTVARIFEGRQGCSGPHLMSRVMAAAAAIAESLVDTGELLRTF